MDGGSREARLRPAALLVAALLLPLLACLLCASPAQARAGCGPQTSYSNCEGADLRGANLSNKHFLYANFRNADLTGANLSGSLFTGSNLSGIQANGANLTGTIVYLSGMAGAHLKNCLLYTSPSPRDS